jgi:hypothetical protein
VDGLAPRQFFNGRRFVFFGDFTGVGAVQVDTLRCFHQRIQVGVAGGVAVQEDRQRLAREHPRRTRLDVGLDTQLQRPGRAAEQGGEVFGQRGSASRGGQVDPGRCNLSGWRSGGACRCAR